MLHGVLGKRVEIVVTQPSAQYRHVGECLLPTSLASESLRDRIGAAGDRTSGHEVVNEVHEVVR